MERTTEFKNILGSFTMKRLSLGEMKEVGIIEAREKQGEIVSINTDNLTFLFAMTDKFITDFVPNEEYMDYSDPPYNIAGKGDPPKYKFNARIYYDLKPVEEVFTHWDKWVQQFRK